MTDADKGKVTFVMMLCIIVALGVSYKSLLGDKRAAENQITELKAQLQAERDHADIKFDRCMKQFLGIDRGRSK